MTDWKIPLFKIYSDEEDINAVSKIIRRGTYWADGPEILEFEKKIAEFVQRKHALVFNSGTSALHSLLLAHDIQDKEVIVPSFTFISTVNSVVSAGGKPVFAESESETFGLDALDVQNKINSNTKAILALHYAGFPSRDIEKLRRIADENNLLLIEDAAESIGASIYGKKVGTFGHSAMFSFCQSKIVSTGEGGAIVTDSKEIYEKVKLIRSHGRVEGVEDYFHSTEDNEYIRLGYNFRMPTILASLGLSQLDKIDKLIEMRKEKANYLNNHLLQFKEITLPKNIEGHNSVYQLYPIKLRDKEIRNSLQDYLTEKGIMSKVYFNPVHLKTFYRNTFNYKEGDLPFTEELSKKILNLPIYPHMDIEEMDYIIESIKDFFKSRETLRGSSLQLKQDPIQDFKNVFYNKHHFEDRNISGFKINLNKDTQNLNFKSNPFENKTILVTGGCGSIGSEIVRQLLNHNPKSIRVFDNRETELFHMEQEFLKHNHVRFLLGDVRDKERLLPAMENVDIIFHTAALKHVPSCEFNPFEAVKTNVNGTNNVIEAALHKNVEKVINISTDKVTNTINTMGSTKLLSERLISSAQYWKGYRKTIFASVRFGNVIGSNGSVIDLFKKQIMRGESLTITNPQMTRFIMSVRQAVKLVLETVSEMYGGEIFILKMPVFRLQDIVELSIEHLAPKYGKKPEEINQKVIGIRPGERMYEDLMTEEESDCALETQNKFIILSQKNVLPRVREIERDYPNYIKTDKKVYSSKEVTPLTKEELKDLIIREGIF